MSLLIWCWNLNRFWKYQTKWGCQRWQRELVSKEWLWGRNFCKEPQGFGSGLKAAESPFFHETVTSGHWCQQRLLPPVVTGCFLSSHTPPPPPGSRCLLPMPYPLKEAVLPGAKCFAVRQNWVQILALVLACCVTATNLLNLSGPSLSFC